MLLRISPLLNMEKLKNDNLYQSYSTNFCKGAIGQVQYFQGSSRIFDLQ